MGAAASLPATHVVATSTRMAAAQPPVQRWLATRQCGLDADADAEAQDAYCGRDRRCTLPVLATGTDNRRPSNCMSAARQGLRSMTDEQGLKSTFAGAVPRKPDWQSLRPMLAFVAPYRWRLVAASIALVVTASLTLGVVQGVRMLIDQGFAAGALDRSLVVFGGLVVLLAAGTYARFYLVSWIGERVTTDIRGAVYAHLDTALSDKTTQPASAAELPASERPASGGRHPLPAREKFAAWLRSVGFANGMQAVVYDRQGANYCGRLWWMLKWAGHENVAVLDGGLQAWQAASGATSGGVEPPRSPSIFTLAPAKTELVTTTTVAANLGRPGQTVVDARGAPRFRGEVEPLDPVAGHIPGALNRPFTRNIGADGKFKPAAVLKAEFEALLAARDPATVVHHCGSGVSAVPNILAMEIAGLGRTALYAGSWSEWCSDASRPVAQG